MPIISNSVQNNGGSSSSVTPRSRTYRSGGTSVRLQEGQTLKGVVSDVHGSEITLSMEDGSTFTGKLPDASQYSIGQKAAFQITGLAENTIYLKAVTGAYLLDIEDTIEQALEEANLPKTERNLDVVRSLLQNQQSISRENILSSIRLCAQFPEADVNAVITMKRLALPLTAESVAQFTNYEKQNHQLVYKMDSLLNSLGEMMDSIGSQVPRLAAQVGTRLLSMALEGNPSPEEMALPATPPADQTAVTNPPALFFDAEGNRISPKAILEGKITAVFDENGKPVPEETLMQSIQIEENAEQEAELSSDNGPIARMRRLLTNLTDNAASRSVETEDYRTPFIREQAGFLLTPSEREGFSKFLSEYPLSEAAKAKLFDGTITAREFLTEIQHAFPLMTEEQAGRLLASKPFQAMVRGQFMSGWTVSPEHMKDEGAMDEVYHKMSRQFQSLANFNEQTFGREIFSHISQNARDMQNNLDFMKTLNQTFQYMQLPLKLQNQNAHGDLYVMTRKESLKKDPRHLKAVLHLELDALGTLDIQITRENTSVSAHFYVAKKAAKELLERNIDLLSDAINKQGFAFTSELSMKEKELDVVKDFISAEAPIGDLKRYNFDLRA